MSAYHISKRAQQRLFDRIRKRLKDRSWSWGMLSAQSGVPRRMLTRYNAGKTRIKEARAHTLCRALDLRTGKDDQALNTYMIGLTRLVAKRSSDFEVFLFGAGLIYRIVDYKVGKQAELVVGRSKGETLAIISVRSPKFPRQEVSLFLYQGEQWKFTLQGATPVDGLAEIKPLLEGKITSWTMRRIATSMHKWLAKSPARVKKTFQ